MKRRDRVAGGLLAGAALASMAVMAHHPSDAHQLALGQLVHGAMIAIVGLMALGFVRFASVLGLGRLTILAGLIAYGVGAFAGIGAATINGFVVTHLMMRGVSDPAVFALAWEANQALARLGAVATGIAYLLWSVALVTGRESVGRGLGVLGLLAGGVPIALLLTGVLSMNLHGAIPIYAGQALWAALAGLDLGSGRLALAASRGM